MSVVLVTGASGSVGPALVEELLARGHEVRTFDRGRVPARSDVTAYTGDLLDRERLLEAIRGVDRVFHLAALLHVSNPDPALLPEYQRVNVEGTRAVLDAAALHGAARVVFFSTIAVYGSPGDVIVDESSETRPETAYAQTKREAESMVLETCNSTGAFLGTVLRLAAVYGPRVKGNYRRLVDAISRRRFIPIGMGANRRTLIFERDAAVAAVLAAMSPAAAGRVYNVTDGEMHTVREIEQAIALALGRRPGRLRIPITPVRFLMHAADLAARLSRRRGAAVRTLDKYLEDVAVSGERIQQELAFVPRYSLLEGWRETVADLNQGR